MCIRDSDVTSPDQLTPPKKKHKKSLPFIILILILIIIAVIFFFSKMHTSSDNSSGTSTPKKTADATKEIYKQNETAAYNGIEITMDSYVAVSYTHLDVYKRQEFIAYARPLIQGSVEVPMKDGLPYFAFRK